MKRPIFETKRQILVSEPKIDFLKVANYLNHLLHKHGLPFERTVETALQLCEDNGFTVSITVFDSNDDNATFTLYRFNDCNQANAFVSFAEDLFKKKFKTLGECKSIWEY